MAKDILKPVNTTNSTSKSITHAAEEPKNWRALGETNINKAIADNPTKKPMCPEEVK